MYLQHQQPQQQHQQRMQLVDFGLAQKNTNQIDRKKESKNIQQYLPPKRNETKRRLVFFFFTIPLE